MILGCATLMHGSELNTLFSYRFAKDDVIHLAEALSLPEWYSCVQKTKATGLEALAVMLRRLTYPNRLCDLVPIFGRRESELSIIFNTVSTDLVVSIFTFTFAMHFFNRFLMTYMTDLATC